MNQTDNLSTQAPFGGGDREDREDRKVGRYRIPKPPSPVRFPIPPPIKCLSEQY
ncbi:MAG: hypothetical protein QNJ65_18885 [Xenococcaceae cyanobacterium MO_234.B1]|nr:hypothetical protein [Xenococcaceae cyanobacterium MO_234.B1]